MKTCSVWSQRHDRYQSDNRETNDKTKPFILIIHDDNFEEVGSFCLQNQSYATIIRVEYTVVHRAYKLKK